jgi:hypothetical protein
VALWTSPNGQAHTTSGYPLTDQSPATSPRVLLIIENRQAAKTIRDTHPDTAVIWCHGRPPDLSYT